MNYTDIYLLGVVAFIVSGLISLTIADDDDCNINHIGCLISALILATLSWVALLALILSYIRSLKYGK